MQKLTGVQEYDINNLSDVYSAIHAIRRIWVSLGQQLKGGIYLADLNP